MQEVSSSQQLISEESEQQLQQYVNLSSNFTMFQQNSQIKLQDQVNLFNMDEIYLYFQEKSKKTLVQIVDFDQIQVTALQKIGDSNSIKKLIDKQVFQQNYLFFQSISNLKFLIFRQNNDQNITNNIYLLQYLFIQFITLSFHIKSEKEIRNIILNEMLTILKLYIKDTSQLFSNANKSKQKFNKSNRNSISSNNNTPSDGHAQNINFKQSVKFLYYNLVALFKLYYYYNDFDNSILLTKNSTLGIVYKQFSYDNIEFEMLENIENVKKINKIQYQNQYYLQQYLNNKQAYRQKLLVNKYVLHRYCLDILMMCKDHQPRINEMMDYLQYYQDNKDLYCIIKSKSKEFNNDYQLLVVFFIIKLSYIQLQNNSSQQQVSHLLQQYNHTIQILSDQINEYIIAKQGTDQLHQLLTEKIFTSQQNDIFSQFQVNQKSVFIAIHDFDYAIDDVVYDITEINEYIVINKIKLYQYKNIAKTYNYQSSNQMDQMQNANIEYKSIGLQQEAIDKLLQVTKIFELNNIQMELILQIPMKSQSKFNIKIMSTQQISSDTKIFIKSIIQQTVSNTNFQFNSTQNQLQLRQIMKNTQQLIQIQQNIQIIESKYQIYFKDQHICPRLFLCYEINNLQLYPTFKLEQEIKMIKIGHEYSKLHILLINYKQFLQLYRQQQNYIENKEKTLQQLYQYYVKPQLDITINTVDQHDINEKYQYISNILMINCQNNKLNQFISQCNDNFNNDCQMLKQLVYALYLALNIQNFDTEQQNNKEYNIIQSLQNTAILLFIDEIYTAQKYNQLQNITNTIQHEYGNNIRLFFYFLNKIVKIIFQWDDYLT